MVSPPPRSWGGTLPPRGGWVMRPARGPAKPNGSVRFGGAGGLRCSEVGRNVAPPAGERVEADRFVEVRRRGELALLEVGEHGRAAVGVGRVGLARGPLDGAAEVRAEVVVGVGARRRAGARVERAAALVVLAPRDG